MTLASEDPCLNIHEDHTLMYNVTLNYIFTFYGVDVEVCGKPGAGRPS